MFRRMTLVSTLLMVALLVSVGNAQQSNPQQSNPQDPSRTGQSTDRTRSSDSRDNNRTQSDRTDSNRAQGDKNNNMGRQDSKLSNSDREFAMKAAEGGKMEVMHAEMALQKSSNDEVKRYAQRMIDDHTKANQELMGIASGKGIMGSSDMHGQAHSTSPEMRTGTTSASSTTAATSSTSSTTGATNPTSATGATTPNTESSGDMRKTDSGMKMSKDHQMAMDRLGKLSGAEFDREYLKMDLNDHKKTVDLFEKQARSGRDAELKAFAEKTLPTLREHHQMARDLAGKVSGSNSGTNR